MSKVKIFAKSIAFHVIIGAIVGWIISSSIDYNSLQKPYLVWVIFASYLNFAIYFLNR